MSTKYPKRVESTGEDHTGLHLTIEPGDDPYNRTIPSLLDSPAQPKRRSLDDMRRLSEMIKAERLQK